MTTKQLALIVVLSLSIDGRALGSIIDDKSDFVGDFTVIDFETFADGTPIVLEPGQAGSFYAGLYHSLGVWISGRSIPVIGRYGPDSPQSIAALHAVGSPTNVLGGYYDGPNPPGDLRLDFTRAVNAVGLATIDRSDGADVRLHIYDAFDGLIETVAFDGPVVDGSILGVDYGTTYDIDYGFFGVFSPNEMIAYATISQDLATFFDDLHFGVIPEPATFFLVTLGITALVYNARLRNTRGRIATSLCVTVGIFFSYSDSTVAENNISGHVSAWVDLTEGPICGDNGWPGCPMHAGLTRIDLEGGRVCAC